MGQNTEIKPPEWTKHIDKMVFARLGDKPHGYIKHSVTPLWDNRYRMNMWVNKDSHVVIDSWFLRFSPDGQLVESYPSLVA